MIEYIIYLYVLYLEDIERRVYGSRYLIENLYYHQNQLDSTVINQAISLDGSFSTNKHIKDLIYYYL